MPLLGQDTGNASNASNKSLWSCPFWAGAQGFGEKKGLGRHKEGWTLFLPAEALLATVPRALPYGGPPRRAVRAILVPLAP